MKGLVIRFIIGLSILLSGITGGQVGTIPTVAEDSSSYVYLGGMPVGISVSAGGVIVVGKTQVVTKEGLQTPLKDFDIKSGDVLVKIADTEIKNLRDIKLALQKCEGSFNLRLMRGQSQLNYMVSPSLDALTGEKRLGLTIKEEVSGLGTLTYIKQNGRFGALGHCIFDLETGLSEQLSNGNLYSSAIIGVVKGKRGTAGELRGILNKKDKPIGSLDRNNNFGVFGNMSEDFTSFEKIEPANRSEVKVGSAYIYTTIEGSTPSFMKLI
jgi:stage IV sporulation protein B